MKRMLVVLGGLTLGALLYVWWERNSDRDLWDDVLDDPA